MRLKNLIPINIHLMAFPCKNIFKADYIIIGSGASGCVLAERLTRDRTTSVILLEAGQDEDSNPIIVAPLDSIDQNVYGPAFFWQGNTLPDPNAGDRVFDWSNGRLLGGGTSIFGMIFTRGTHERFDEWTSLVGPDWTGDKVYETYTEMEHFYGPLPNRGHTGRTIVRYGPADSNATPQFIAAMQSTGVPGSNITIEDYNAANQPIGVFTSWQYWQFPDQTRASASRTYLSHNSPYLTNVINDKLMGVDGRKLKIETQTTATHLIWSKKTPNKVKGVFALKKGVPTLYRAKKKVIVSAGFNSSAFLQVNGIGPRAVLETAGVPVRVDLPGVGANLRDAPYLIGVIMQAPPGTTLNSQPGTFQSFGAFLPDCRPGHNLNRKIQINGGVIDNLLGPGTGRQALLVLQPLRPASSGSIKIQDADPLKIAAVDLGMLDNSDDLNFLQAVYAQIVVPMVTYLQDNYGYVAAYPTLAQLQDPAFVTTFIQNNVGNTHHYQCFNKMGPVADGGVVDDWGNVHGVEGLMTVDDGIPPITTDGNTAATAEMVAYRIANHLLSE
jgi:choline dehydrogenase